jgi:arsenite methyltransferase
MDCGGIRGSVREKYRAVAERAEGHFPYPVGREGARALGYADAVLEAMPREAVERFVGVGHPLSLRAARPGERVLDIGCGSGLDVFIAASTAALAVGLDLTREMLPRSRGRAAFVHGDVESLPFAPGSFDLVVSNGALNLAPDKRRAFREIARVLRPGGAFAAADLAVVDTLPASVLASMDAWSN